MIHRESVDRVTLFKSPVVEIRDNVCLRTCPRRGAPTDPLPFHEVCIPRSGVWLRHLGRKDLIVDSSQVHLFNRGEVHRVSHPGRCGDRNSGLLFGESHLSDVLEVVDPSIRDRSSAPFSWTHQPLGLSVWAMHSALLRAARSSTLMIEVEELALRLMEIIVADRLVQSRVHTSQMMESPKTRRAHLELSAAARSLIAEEYADHHTLSSLSDVLGTSPYHLARVYRACTGSTVHSSLMTVRLQASLERILEGDEALDDIAAATGFADRSHLSRSITRHVGISPSVIRRSSVVELGRRLSREGPAFPPAETEA